MLSCQLVGSLAHSCVYPVSPSHGELVGATVIGAAVRGAAVPGVGRVTTTSSIAMSPLQLSPRTPTICTSHPASQVAGKPIDITCQEVPSAPFRSNTDVQGDAGLALYSTRSVPMLEPSMWYFMSNRWMRCAEARRIAVSPSRRGELASM